MYGSLAWRGLWDTAASFAWAMAFTVLDGRTDGWDEWMDGSFLKFVCDWIRDRLLLAVYP